MWRGLLFICLLLCLPVCLQAQLEQPEDSGITLSKSVGLIMRFPASALSIPLAKGETNERKVEALVAQGICLTLVWKLQEKEVFGAGIGGFLAGANTDNIDFYASIPLSVFRHWAIAPSFNVETEQIVFLLCGNWPL